MRIGNHELVGEVGFLEKPLIAMKKRKDGQTSYYVQGFIRKKFVFSERPKAILHV